MIRTSSFHDRGTVTVTGPSAVGVGLTAAVRLPVSPAAAAAASGPAGAALKMTRSPGLGGLTGSGRLVTPA